MGVENGIDPAALAGVATPGKTAGVNDSEPAPSPQHLRRFRTVLAGCGRMGASQARILAESGDFTLVGVCDAVAEKAATLGAAHGVPHSSALGPLLEHTHPDVVVICSHNTSHAPLTLEAANFSGVRGIYCEKPMATNLREGRAMVATCRERGVVLAINHQRRLGRDLAAMKAAMDAGAIGTVRSLRLQSPGDLLSDGTHAIDSLLFLLGDRAPESIFGSLHRVPPSEQPPPPADAGGLEKPGWRFGHVVESGAVAVLQFPKGPRVELFAGDLVERRRAYQDYEVVGDRGRLWRTGDRTTPNVFICDADGGTHEVDDRAYPLQPWPAPGGGRGSWRPLLEANEPLLGLIDAGFRALAHSLRTGQPHPLRGELALAGLEVLMAIYESARLHRRVSLPLAQEQFPLELMIATGELPA
jgi:UDP-N-acetyl-2-amino-2-deoxyglucuronate dehydrogenase